MAGDLHYLSEHLSCRHYVSDYRCCFRYREDKAGIGFSYDSFPHNLVVFILGGKPLISCNEYHNRTFEAGDIVFFPKGSAMSCKILTEGSAVTCLFDSMKSICDKFTLHSYWPIRREMSYDFEPVKIRPQLSFFLESMKYYLGEGVNCEHFHEMKQQEMFLLFRWFYTKEEVTKLFYPIIGSNLDFRSLVLENYLKVGNVQELAGLARMGRSNFDSTFKKEFGMSAWQWDLKQKAKHVKYYLSTPEATISDVMAKFNFNSPTHFTRFCKQQFGCTPKELMAQLRDV